MTNVFSTVWTWVHSKLGTITAGAKAIEPEVLAWASNFLAGITPVIKEAATDAVLTAVAVPGSGSVKAVAAFAAASADLIKQGVPVVDNDLKAAIQIAYNALPSSVTGNVAATAVVTAADNAVDSAAAKVEGAAPSAASGATA
jgi:hypothetical protein